MAALLVRIEEGHVCGEPLPPGGRVMDAAHHLSLRMARREMEW